MEKNPWTIKQSQEVYKNNWIKVEHHEVLDPSQNPGVYGTVRFKNIAVGVVPLDEDYNTWVIGQYRFPLDIYSWEIPEGGAPVGTDPLLSAQRELQEEAGLQAKSWTKILDLHTSNSVCDESAIIYVAQDLTIGIPNPDDNEDLAIKKMPFKMLYDWVMNGKVTDAMSVAAVLKLKLLIDQDRF